MRHLVLDLVIVVGLIAVVLLIAFERPENRQRVAGSIITAMVLGFLLSYL